MKKLVKPLHALYITQFLSAFADNMVLFLTLAVISLNNYPSYYLGVVQAAFFFAYVILAPFVGIFADKNAKSNVLLIGNLIKGLGVALLIVGVNPVLSYLVVGFGAVIYSPAKYGILPDLTKNEDELLNANGKVEAFTILSILVGSVFGGFLATKAESIGMTIPVLICILFYVISMVGTLWITKIEGNKGISYKGSVSNFFKDFKTLFKDPSINFSLIGSGAFWMSSAVIRLGFIALIPLTALGITSLDKISMLVATTAVGIVIGSLVTHYLVPAKHFYKCIRYGYLLAIVAIISVFSTSHIIFTIATLLIVGFMGGVFIVPLNTVIQDRGKVMIGAGKTVAVQNFINNLLMLIGVGLYTLITMSGTALSIKIALVGMGVLLIIFMLFLTFILGQLQNKN